MKYLQFVLFLIIPVFVSAQHFEVGLSAGISNYQGDLAPHSTLKLAGQSQAAYGAFARYNFSDFVAIKLGATRGTVTGDDAVENRSSRNLSFESNIFDVALTGEFNILGYQPYNLARIFSPYVFGGVAFFRFNPTTEYSGETIRLQPLGTEGQGLPGFAARYDLTELSIPMGVGLKYAINDMWNIGLEISARMTFTDYLDDVSTVYVDRDLLEGTNGELAAILSDRSPTPNIPGSIRGNPNNNDWYYLAMVSVSYNFADNGLVGSRGRSSRKTGCPVF